VKGIEILTMARLLLSVFFVCFSVGSVFSGPIVATYNVRNYLTMDRLADGKWRKEYPKPESEKQVIRDTILAVRPDILILQEMGSSAHLEELRRDLANEGLKYEGRFLCEAADDDRRVAALWRGGLRVKPIGHDDLKIKFFGEIHSVRRGLMELEIRTDGQLWRIFGAHLKSKYTDDKRDPLAVKKRSAEAEAVRDRILEVVGDPEETRYLVMGDLNDTPDNRPLRALYKRGKRAISVDIPAYDGRGEMWTHYYKKATTYSKVDYILRSPGFRELTKARGTIHDPKNYYAGSDHRLVWVEIPGL